MSTSRNDRQREAIEHVYGPMLVVAGAGTGKTTVLVERVARLIRDGYARPDEVLALTFTDNAAAEMRARVQQELAGADCSNLQATTFHSYCMGVLARCGKRFGVLTKEDLWVFLRSRLRRLPLQYYLPARDPGEFLEALLDFFERCHDELVTAAEYRAYVEKLRTREAPLPRVTKSKGADDISEEEVLARCEEIARVYLAAEQMLAEEGLGTYGHMILRATEILRTDPRVLAQEQARARFLLIDEFQDVNVAQIDLAQFLAGRDENIFAVGDPDQAIYRFRGASAAAFKEFAKRFPKTRGVVLDQNQRSLTPVLKCAFACISRNPALHCVMDGTGHSFDRQPLESAREQKAKAKGKKLPFLPVEVVVGDDGQEAVDVAEAIERLQREYEAREETEDASEKRHRFGILYRSHAHRDNVVKELAERKLPFAVTGIDALETAEVRDLLACLQALNSASDSGSLFRVAALPLFKIDPVRMREALRAANEDTSFASVLEKVPGGPEVLVAVEDARIAAREANNRMTTVLELVLARFAFDPAVAAVAAFRNFVAEWMKKPIVQTGQLLEFLRYIKYFRRAGGRIDVAPGGERSPRAAVPHDPKAIKLMTVHAAKGLEFDHVFVLRLNTGSFPVSYREKLFEFPQELRRGLVPEGDSSEIHRQEERRLVYVALTRARDSLAICARPGTGKRDPRPAAFVRELMDDLKARPYWRERLPEPLALDIAASAQPQPRPGVGAWLLMPPAKLVQVDSLSATAIESYETCPLQFKIERDWNIPGEVAAAMQYGNAMHTVLKDYYEAVRAGRPKSEAEVLQCLRDTLAAMHFDDPLQRELYEKQGCRQLQEFVCLRQREAPFQVIGTERGFVMRVGGVRVRGRVDRLDRIAGNRVAVVDYKTGKPQTQKDADESLQLSIYAMAVREQWHFVPEQLMFYNLQDNTAVMTTRSEQDLQLERDRVVEVARRIAAGNFEATPGYHCRWCAYRSLCPETEERLYTIQAVEPAGVN